jgi:hypothetical protein
MTKRALIQTIEAILKTAMRGIAYPPATDETLARTVIEVATQVRLSAIAQATSMVK